MDDYLMHHGILGMKWGVRRYQNEDGTRTSAGKKRRRLTDISDYRKKNGKLTRKGEKHKDEFTDYGTKGGTIKKGSSLYRVSTDLLDNTYDNKKYVSTSKLDNQLWEDYLGPRYKWRGKSVYSIEYTTMDDIKVASQTKLGEAFIHQLNTDARKTFQETSDAYAFLGIKDPGVYYPHEAASINMAAQTKLGKEMVNDLLSQGYGAVTDYHGKNTSMDPIIILDPDNKLRIKEISSI